MKRLFEKLSLQHSNTLVKQLMGACLGLVLICLLVVVKLIMGETHVVLVPQYKSSQPLNVRTDMFCEAYVAKWAEGVLLHLLTISPETVDERIDDTLRIAAGSSVGSLRDQLVREATRIKRDHVSTVFYPKDTHVDSKNRTVTVTGQFHTWFGVDQKPVIQPKTWRLMWKRGHQGVILLKECIELTQGDKA